MFQGCNVDNIEDIANGSVSLKSLAMSKSRDRFKRQHLQAASIQEMKSDTLPSQASAVRHKSLPPNKGKDKKTGPRHMNEFSAGLEILKIHQSFAAVSSKVTARYMFFVMSQIV